MNPIRSWNRLFFGPVSARPLGAFRIAYGVLMLIYLSLMTVEFDLWYTGAGVLRGTESREAAGPLRFSALQFTDNPAIARAVLAATVAAAVGFTLGWRTRVMSVLFYLGMITLYHRNVLANGGPDAVPLILSFYMMFCPSGAAYSLDARRAAKKRGTVAEPLIVPWGMRLLQMQICLIYFQSCVIKSRGEVWLNGTTVHYVLFNREFSIFNMEWLGAVSLADQPDDAWGSPARVRGGVLAVVPAHPALGHPGRGLAPHGHLADHQRAGLRRGDDRHLPDLPGARRASESLALARPAGRAGSYPLAVLRGKPLAGRPACVDSGAAKTGMLNGLAGSWDAIIHAALSRAYVCRPRWLRAFR